MNYEAILFRKLGTLYPDADIRADARAVLETYGTEHYEQEPVRVRLAVLKLAGADLDEVKKMTALARQDFRDVLAWAEYPGQSKNWSLPDGHERQKLVESDRAEYEEWLSR